MSLKSRPEIKRRCWVCDLDGFGEAASLASLEKDDTVGGSILTGVAISSILGSKKPFGPISISVCWSCNTPDSRDGTYILSEDCTQQGLHEHKTRTNGCKRLR
jgi:hypothetical protein